MFKLEFDKNTAVTDQFETQSELAYPNPFSEAVFINYQGIEILQLAIYNLAGEVVLHAEKLKHGSTIATHSLPTGIYFVEFYLEGRKHRQKLIKIN